MMKPKSLARKRRYQVNAALETELYARLLNLAEARDQTPSECLHDIAALVLRDPPATPVERALLKETIGLSLMIFNLVRREKGEDYAARMMAAVESAADAQAGELVAKVGRLGRLA